MEHILGYTSKLPGGPLRDAGATEVFADVGKSRAQRGALLRRIADPLSVRPGDTVKVLVYSLRNLSGSHKVDAQWRKIIADAGATLAFVDRPKEPKRKTGPKSPYVSHPDDWDAWHAPDGLSDADRLEQISRRAGMPVTRNMANQRYGTRGDPKPKPEVKHAAE